MKQPEVKILASPAKTEYKVGEGFDAAGLKTVLSTDGNDIVNLEGGTAL